MRKRLRASIRARSALAGLSGAVAVGGCRRAEVPPPLPPIQKPVDDTGYLHRRQIGSPIDGHPWIAHVTPVDLDQGGLMDVAVCDAWRNEVTWIRHYPRGVFHEHVLAKLPAPVHAAAVDRNGDGHFDLLVACMDEVFPNNDCIGSAVILENDGRPDILYSNGDGFGPAAVRGPRPWHGLQWLENLGNGNFRYHRVGVNLPGVYSPIGVDLDGDGNMDVVACSVFAEDWNKADSHPVTLMWFRNDGHMHFTPHILAYLPKDIIAIAADDFTGDGRPDLVTGGFDVNPPFVNMGRVLLWTRKPFP